jgi:hypothetical protein
MLQCFREIGKPWPEARILREPPLPRAKDDKPRKGKQKEGAATPDVDPFGAPGTTTDPFGAPPAGGAAPPPAGGAAPAGADPFGGTP